MGIHEYAKHMKAKTDAGAILMWDGEVHDRPTWLIGKKRIAFVVKGPCSTSTFTLWEHPEDQYEAEKDIRSRIRVLADA